jgi:hypothetical protein
VRRSALSCSKKPSQAEPSQAGSGEKHSNCGGGLQFTMKTHDTLIPTRFMSTICYLVATIMVFSTMAENVLAALPPNYTAQILISILFSA